MPKLSYIDEVRNLRYYGDVRGDIDEKADLYYDVYGEAREEFDKYCLDHGKPLSWLEMAKKRAKHQIG